MLKECQAITVKTMEGTVMSMNYFMESRKIFHKYHETACRPLIKYYIDARRQHLKKGDKQAANNEDLQMRKWLMDVATVLNANIYTQLEVSQACYFESEKLYSTQLIMASAWGEIVSQIRQKVTPPEAPKEMTKV